jgi:tetratricopeptide (TPR) repeat protein
MKKKSGLVWIILLMVLPLFGQNERKAIRNGVRAYEEGNYPEAEVEFRKAQSIDEESFEAEFNTGTALYGQEKYDETVKQYQSLLSRTEDTEKEAKIWHNIGNSLLEAQQYAPSIEAYKNSLRKNPGDDDTRYNLAYAKKKLKEQQQQKQESGQNQENQQEKEQNEDQQQGDQQEQDQNRDQQQGDQQEQDQNRDQQQEDPQEQQRTPMEISREDAERMLKAIQQQEKEVKEQVDKKKAAAAKTKTEKDW